MSCSGQTDEFGAMVPKLGLRPRLRCFIRTDYRTRGGEPYAPSPRKSILRCPGWIAALAFCDCSVATHRAAEGNSYRTLVTCVDRPVGPTSRNDANAPGFIVTSSPTFKRKDDSTAFCAQTWPLANVTTSSPWGREDMAVIIAVSCSNLGAAAS